MTQADHSITTFAPGFLEFLSDGVVVLDRQQIITVNRAATHILGWDRAELIRRPWSELLHEQPSLTNPPPIDEAAPLKRVAWFPFDMDSSRGDEETDDDTALLHHSDLTFNCKNGSQREVRASFSPFYLPNLLTETADRVKLARQINRNL